MNPLLISRIIWFSDQEDYQNLALVNNKFNKVFDQLRNNDNYMIHDLSLAIKKLRNTCYRESLAKLGQRNIVDVILQIAEILPDNDRIIFLKWSERFCDQSVQWRAPEVMGEEWIKLTNYLYDFTLNKTYQKDIMYILSAEKTVKIFY